MRASGTDFTSKAGQAQFSRKNPVIRTASRTAPMVGSALPVRNPGSGSSRSAQAAPAAALTLAVIALAPAGRRWAAAAWWFLPAFAAGGFWYLRNLIAIGNPLPQLESLGPISLPHPERLQTARPDFNVAHYATDTGVWREYFGPGLDHAFGALWPLVIGAAILGALLAVLHGDRVLSGRLGRVGR